MVRQLSRLDPRLRLAAAALLILAAPILWYLGSPLFTSRVVDEAPPPTAFGASAPTSAVGPMLNGQFGVVDAVHQGEGTVLVIDSPGAERVLRFEAFRVTNGPDLYVYLSGHPAPRSSAQLHEMASFEVGTLRGNVGSQNYELPSDLDLSRFSSVVIYCKRFSTVFSTAELTRGG